MSGWGGSSGSLAVVAGSGGGHAAQLTATKGASSTYAYTTSKPVTKAVAGTAYTLDGQVESAVPGQSVCLVLKEIKAGTSTSVGSAKSCLTATSAWQSIPTVGYTIKTAGDSLTVNVSESPAVSGAIFAFDNLVLATGSGGGGSGDTQAPSIPQERLGAREQRDVGDGVVGGLDRQRRRGRLPHRPWRREGRDRRRQHHHVDGQRPCRRARRTPTPWTRLTPCPTPRASRPPRRSRRRRAAVAAAARGRPSRSSSS